MEIFHISGKHSLHSLGVGLQSSPELKQTCNSFKINWSFESDPEISKKPRKASVWYKMPSYFFAFVGEKKRSSCWILWSRVGIKGQIIHQQQRARFLQGNSCWSWQWKQARYSPWSTEHSWVELGDEILGQKGKEAIRTQNSLDGKGALTWNPLSQQSRYTDPNNSTCTLLVSHGKILPSKRQIQSQSVRGTSCRCSLSEQIHMDT